MFYSMWRLEITIAHILLPHTHPSIVPWVHNPLEARGDRGVCMLCDPIYSGQISSAAVLGALWWRRPCFPLLLLKCSCGWGGACSTWAASNLCLWLRYIASLCTVAIPGLILHWQKLYATKRHKRTLHQSLLYPPASCWSPSTQVTAQKLQKTDFFIQYWQSMDVLVRS